MYGEDYSGRFRLWQCGMKGMVELQHCLLSMYAYIYIYTYMYISTYLVETAVVDEQSLGLSAILQCTYIHTQCTLQYIHIPSKLLPLSK